MKVAKLYLYRMKKVNIEITSETTRQSLKSISALNSLPMKNLATKVLDSFIKDYHNDSAEAKQLISELQDQAA